MDLTNFAGEILDDKYKVERELGRGGMGTVYLATHLGTERPVAVKIISPQFMQRAEFVERFRREARAAGRLRHPNVVDVTDFGFSNTDKGQVAYLVMEYLDGCTLGEILEEEKNLPVSWTLDILEQVCSAVHEAHGQGIIHRDLKPDNIWLEPNQRGGYTVKVLDFGIAKLEEAIEEDTAEVMAAIATAPTLAGGGSRATMVDAGSTMADGGGTLIDNGGSTRAGDTGTLASEKATMALGAEFGTMAGEAGTLIQPEPDQDDKKTAILQPATDEEENGHSTGNSNDNKAKHSTGGGHSLVEARSTSHLTRVGAVLGTPLYMSPEQCRGEHLDARSDIYSLSVIAYQMLSGHTPFDGDYKAVMDAHQNTPPPPLTTKGVRKKIRKLIHDGLSKNTDERPPSAEAFASEFRAQSEGIGTLLRRALMIYSEHLPKFVGLGVLLFLPAILLTLINITVNILSVTETIGNVTSIVLKVVFTLLSVVSVFFCTHLIGGTTTWLVNQILAFPLRPVSVRPALEATKKKWKKLIGTGFLAATITAIGWALCLFPGFILNVLLMLVAPVVMMENLKGFAAFKRSKELVMRSLRTSIAAMLILVFVPACVGGLTGFVAAVTVKAFTKSPEKVVVNENGETVPYVPKEGDTARTTREGDFNIDFDDDGVRINEPKNEKDKTMRQVSRVAQDSSTSLLMLPFQILIASLSSIIGALLYLKTRQAGGESLRDLFEQFEEADRPRKKWQERVRQRLIQSGRITSKSTQQ